MVMTRVGVREGSGDQILNRKFWKGFAHVTAGLCIPAGFCIFSSFSTLYLSPWVPPPAAEK